MSRVAYVNGAYLPLSRARVSIQDRGLQFGDAVYEVWAVRSGRLFDLDAHLARLSRSLSAVRIAAPMSEAALMSVIGETRRRNRVRNGIVYLQVSRSAAPRDHAFPPPYVRPCIIVTARALDTKAIDARAASGVRVITLPETRWARRDIKSVNLLPNVLARQAAREAGAFEAWFVDADGEVTEGTASNAWIVDAQGVLKTRPLSNDLLHGVTRAALAAIARGSQIRLEERGFTVAEAQCAREAFMSSASNPALPITHIDGLAIGTGRPGPVAQALRAAYLGAPS